MINVLDSKTGLTFKFKSHKEKENFFNLWDKYEVIEDLNEELKGGLKE